MELGSVVRDVLHAACCAPLNVSWQCVIHCIPHAVCHSLKVAWQCVMYCMPHADMTSDSQGDSDTLGPSSCWSGPWFMNSVK